MSRRPHWDDDLIDAVFKALSYTYLAQGWAGGIAIDLDESVYPLIAAVEDWHKAKRDSRIRTHSEGCWRWHNECAEGLIEAQQRKIQQLANELLTVGGAEPSGLGTVRRLVEAEATIQRVRELHYNTATHHPSGCCSECGGTYPCPTVRALDGDA